VKVSVIGSGSWGTAFSRLLVRRGHEVQTLTMTRAEADELNARHENVHFLPGVSLPEQLTFVAMEEAELAESDIIVYAVPTQVVREVAKWVSARRLPAALQLSLAKGLERGTLKRPTEIIAEETGDVTAALSGPNHAEEVARDMPTASVIACSDAGMAGKLQRAVNAETFRVYTNEDVVGVEFCGAAKNPIALAVGMADGLGYGDNTRATLMTRSLAEIARLGMKLGADFPTFAGLAGIGDLIATCTSRHSRNRRAGELIAQGHDPATVESMIGQVVEGIPTVYALHDLSRRMGVDMPVTGAVYEAVAHGVSPRELVGSLMGRELTSEGARADLWTLIAQLRQTAQVAQKTAKQTAKRTVRRLYRS